MIPAMSHPPLCVRQILLSCLLQVRTSRFLSLRSLEGFHISRIARVRSLRKSPSSYPPGRFCSVRSLLLLTSNFASARRCRFLKLSLRSHSFPILRMSYYMPPLSKYLHCYRSLVVSYHAYTVQEVFISFPQLCSFCLCHEITSLRLSSLSRSLLQGRHSTSWVSRRY